MMANEKTTHPPFNFQTVDGLCDLIVQRNNGEKLTYDRVYTLFFKCTSYKQQSKPNSKGKVRNLAPPKLYEQVVDRLEKRGDLNAN